MPVKKKCSINNQKKTFCLSSPGKTKQKENHEEQNPTAFNPSTTPLKAVALGNKTSTHPPTAARTINTGQVKRKRSFATN
jgi:hypothetical protein